MNIMTGSPRPPRGFHRVPVTDAAEIAASEALTERLIQIDTLLDRYSKIAQLKPKPTTEIADDDARTSWLHLSHFVAACMTMASDSLASTQQLLLPNGQLEHRLTAHFPLLRSTIESAGTALWLLQPDDQRERIVRLLRARTDDIDWDMPLVKAASRIADQNTPEGRSVAQRAIRNAAARRKRHRDQIRAIATREGIDADEYSEGLPGYERVIQQATEHLNIAGTPAPTVWSHTPIASPHDGHQPTRHPTRQPRRNPLCPLEHEHRAHHHRTPHGHDDLSTSHRTPRLPHRPPPPP